MKNGRLNQPKVTASYRVMWLATKKDSGEKPVAQDYQKLKIGRKRDRWVDTWMDQKPL